MKQLKVALFVGIIILSFVTAGLTAEVAKIGTFNINKVLAESSAGKMAQKEIRAKFSEIQERLKTEKESLEKMKKDIEREAMVLSAEKSQEKQREFRIRVNDFKKMQDDMAKEFKKKESELRAKMINEIFAVAGEIGTEEDFLLILEEKTSGIFYRPDHLDITDKVVKKYNLKTSKAN